MADLSLEATALIQDSFAFYPASRDAVVADAEHVEANLTLRVSERSTASQVARQLYQRSSNSPGPQVTIDLQA
jgi:hypothetical protein